MNDLSLEQRNDAQIEVFATAQAASEAVAGKILATVGQNPKAVLGLATGQTPRRVYAKLIDAFRAGKISFSETETFNLDEYCGLSASHSDSFAAYMRRELFDLTNFNPDKINLVDGSTSDALAEAQRYARLLATKRIDLQLLGIGTNGHIGFNEPGSKSNSRVRVVELSDETLNANRPTLIKLEDVPCKAITMGIADILDTREIVILATGAAKAEAVRRSIEDLPNDACPASYLSSHGNVHWVLDRDAAALLSH
ncbi:glucosamine-6-phosphate deaminase [Brucella sp. BE17]|uniref:glucosamine-6-phosphate deaminase n=1 Tax=Brucella sp. BE17 TaxID=3142977 RepID=UPI0031BB1F67